MRKVVGIFFILIITNVLAQETVRTKLNGKIIADMRNLEGIYVVNLKTEKSEITGEGGYFSIEAIPGDTLVFSSVQLKGIRIGLEQKHFQKELFFVKMEPMINQLPEVLVRRYDNINAVSLGIVPKGIKHYTPAERKYATATSGKLNPMGLDPLLNLISGRTAMLKKEIEVEKKEFYIQQLENMFDKDHFVGNLKIPAAYIKGFEYYIVENTRFTAILDSKNKTMTDFLMGELAIKYNEIIACENE
ncbi:MULTISPECIES: hypothetical protein [unclassified Flavobacterium]|jgi:hypothetical protein|uniref:hypothetical protein n=1 Tax=unclassified Flavobacterium TaxID=196869 RepID=UPI0025BA99FF|nr:MULTISPECIES: hypothetical protein [unclassified Flavobacterium]